MDIKAISKVAQDYYERRELSCGEAIIKAVKDAYALPFDDSVLKLATGMAGGIGGQGCICGALSGAVMSLGMIYGRSELGASADKIKALSAELYSFYEDNFSFFCCRTQLKDFEKNSPEARAHCLHMIDTMLTKACEIIEREGLTE